MSTTIAIGKHGKVEETFVVAEPRGLAIKLINKMIRQFKETEPTFGMDSWSVALEIKTTLALISENESKDKDFDLFYDTEKGRIISL